MKTIITRVTHTMLAVALIAAVSVVTTPSVAAGSFPGTNGLIAFTTNRDGNSEIYTMNPDGSNPINLTNHPAQDRAASWSADGKNIAFQSNRDGNWEIYTMQADGSNQKRLTNNSQDDLAPSWSADGTKLAFVRVVGGDKEIFTMDAAGAQQTNITNHVGVDTDPSWSPDGTKILFTSHRPVTGALDIYTMNPDGSNVAIYVGGAGDKRQGSWAPDGTKIVMVADLDRTELHISGPGIHRQLTQDFNNEHVAPTGAWSPDGTTIVFYMAVDCNFEFCPPDGGSSEIYTLDPHHPTDSRRNISNRNDAADEEPVWQPIPIIVPIQITADTLPEAKARSPYSFSIPTSGGSGAKTFSIVQGRLPKGLSLDSTTGTIQGVPKHHGSTTFTVQVSDDSGTDTQQLTLVVKKAHGHTLPPATSTLTSTLNVSFNLDNSSFSTFNVVVNVLPRL